MAEVGEFPTGLCGCCSVKDCGVGCCLKLMCCGPCNYGSAIETVDLGPCCPCCCAIAYCPVCVGAYNRHKLTEKYNIDESCIVTVIFFRRLVLSFRHLFHYPRIGPLPLLLRVLRSDSRHEPHHHQGKQNLGLRRPRILLSISSSRPLPTPHDPNRTEPNRTEQSPFASFAHWPSSFQFRHCRRRVPKKIFTTSE